MRCTFFLVWFGLMAFSVEAQKYVSTEGVITFFSSATLEDIKADNKKITSLFNASTKEIAFSVPINQFQFAKKLMQEHFNEKYMESHKYPKSIFSGKLEDFSEDRTGLQRVRAVGKLTIHGVTRQVTIPGTVEVRPDGMVMKSKFMVKVEDYKIKIPRVLWQNIAEEVEVTVDLTYKPQ
jgi:polyisoprenoid-binding protein YceI